MLKLQIWELCINSTNSRTMLHLSACNPWKLSVQHIELCSCYAVLVAEAIFFGKRASRNVVLSILLVCVGVGLSTITDPNVGSNSMGFLVGLGAILSTAAYQIWAGSKQKELNVGSMALLEQYSPIAACFLSIMVPIFEPLGINDPKPTTLLGYSFSTLLWTLPSAQLMYKSDQIPWSELIGTTDPLPITLLRFSHKSWARLRQLPAVHQIFPNVESNLVWAQIVHLINMSDCDPLWLSYSFR